MDFYWQIIAFKFLCYVACTPTTHRTSTTLFTALSYYWKKKKKIKMDTTDNTAILQHQSDQLICVSKIDKPSRQTNKQTHKMTNRHIDRQIDIQTDRKKDRQLHLFHPNHPLIIILL